jgi:hypothetical protein
MPDNISKVIQITKVETQMFETATQYKLTTLQGKFKFYTNKKSDGQETVAFKQFKDMELKVGSTVEIWYTPLQKEYQGKSYTDNIIVSFREPQIMATPSQTAPPQPISSVKNEPRYETEPKNDEFWQKRAYKQCLWNYWLTGTDRTTPLGETETDKVWQVFNQIDADADKRFNKSEEPPLPEIPF